MSTAMLTPATATARFARLIGEHVIVTFSDGHEEAGILENVGWDLIEVTHVDGSDIWTPVYSLTGDPETPHVTDVRLDVPQTETLF